MNLLATLRVRVVGFIVFPKMYQKDPDFGQICSKGVGEIIICIMVFYLEVCSHVFLFVLYGSVSAWNSMPVYYLATLAMINSCFGRARLILVTVASR